ncbi:MAG: alpha/beta hydrolase [Albidovulum sp.]|uniref:alpha/beta fold hydrolase n=1 Tax=Albidovulum sp. TaxID=1872424 RepID=UPI003CBE70CD
MSRSTIAGMTVSGQGPTLVLVHGIGVTGATWQRIAAKLAATHRVVTYDLRGHGAAKTGNLPFALADLVDDLDRVIDAAGGERVALAGHSLGGMIAAAWARAHPGRARALGILSSVAGRTPDERGRLHAIAARIHGGEGPALIPVLANNWFSQDFIHDNPALIAARVAQVLSVQPEVLANVFDIFGETEMDPWLPELKLPVLLMTGADDLACSPERNTEMARRLSDVELCIVPGVRHSMLAEAPDTIAERLGSFFLRHSHAQDMA